jgi:hypothetical protein
MGAVGWGWGGVGWRLRLPGDGEKHRRRVRVRAGGGCAMVLSPRPVSLSPRYSRDETRSEEGGCGAVTAVGWARRWVGPFGRWTRRRPPRAVVFQFPAVSRIGVCMFSLWPPGDSDAAAAGCVGSAEACPNRSVGPVAWPGGEWCLTCS